MTNNLKIIGRGKISTIFTDGLYAYKTYPNDYPIEWINYEFDTHQKIQQQSSLPMVKYEDMLESRQIKMDYIKGMTLADRMRKEKYKFGLEDFTDLQKQIFQYEINGLKDAFSVFNDQIKSSQLSDSLKNNALKSLYQMDYKQTLCHLDFHLENILYDGSKYVIIDWVNAKSGNPVMDIARSYIILKQYAPRLANKYLKMICDKSGISALNVHQAVPLLAFLRILENDTDPFKTKLEQMIMEENHD